MLKKQKVEYVKKLQKEIKTYKTVGILPIDAIPDRLVQKARNGLKANGTKFVIARHTLIHKIVESDPRLAPLKDQLQGNYALLLSNEEPDKLNTFISTNKIKLGAKPNQVSPSDISIESGETSIAPGQAVTDLKAAGIDVQIQKRKVVISKSKVLVAKGAKISTGIAKALKMLDIYPFEAGTRLRAVMYDGLLFNERALSINTDYVTSEIMQMFTQANMLTISMGFVTQYNVSGMVGKAYNSAMALGMGAKIPVPELTQKLIALAAMEAAQVKPLVKEEAHAAATPDAPAADAPKPEDKKEESK